MLRDRVDLCPVTLEHALHGVHSHHQCVSMDGVSVDYRPDTLDDLFLHMLVRKGT